MDSRIYLVIIVILAVLLVYFLILAPGSSSSSKTTTIILTTIPNVTSINSSVNSSTATRPNSTQNFSASKLGWVRTTGYPTPIGQEKCIYFSNYTYCIGGTTNINYTSDAYFSKVLGTGLGPWTETTPLQIIPAGCILYKKSIFCITGELLQNHEVVNQTYYSYPNSTGLSIWNQTTDYPINGSTKGCVASGIIVYCVSGMLAINKSITPDSFYATISPSKIGQWTQTTPFPIDAEPQCFVYDFTIFCMGSYVGSNGLATYAYYAPITAYGIDSWKSTTPPPNTQGDISCYNYNNFIYCIGGLDMSNYNNSQAYYTGLSAGGVNGWHKVAPYPISNGTASSCITTNSTTFCIGGQISNTSYINNVYYTRSFI